MPRLGQADQGPANALRCWRRPQVGSRCRGGPGSATTPRASARGARGPPPRRGRSGALGSPRRPSRSACRPPSTSRCRRAPRTRRAQHASPSPGPRAGRRRWSGSSPRVLLADPPRAKYPPRGTHTAGCLSWSPSAGKRSTEHAALLDRKRVRWRPRTQCGPSQPRELAPPEGATPPEGDHESAGDWECQIRRQGSRRGAGPRPARPGCQQARRSRSPDHRRLRARRPQAGTRRDRRGPGRPRGQAPQGNRTALVTDPLEHREDRGLRPDGGRRLGRDAVAPAATQAPRGTGRPRL